jgi:cell division septum initiation protein DivIVA
MTQPYFQEPIRSVGGEERVSPVASQAAALEEISRATEVLRQRLEAVVASANRPVDPSTNETELGRLFVRAQSFVDHSVAEARRQASQILAEARTTADGIISEARQQAEEVLEDARRQPSIPLEVLQQLEKTIDSFSRTNSELTHELAELHSNLDARTHHNGHVEIDATPSSPPRILTVPEPSMSEPSQKGWDYKAG